MADTRTPVAAPRQQFINIDLVRRILQCNGLNGTSRSVLLTVGMHANTERQQCFCSVGTLAHKSGWSRRTVNEHLTRLQKLGYLSLIGTHHSGTHIYQVRLDHLPADGAPDTPAPPAAAAPLPCASCIPPVQELHTPPAAAAPEEGVEQGAEQPGKEESAHDTPAATPQPATTVRPSLFEIAQPALPQPPSPAPATPPAMLTTPATATAAPISADTIGLLNAQRQRNGKDPLCHRDIVQIGTEAAQAGITPLAAAQWILAKPQRNFFRASFYAPPATPAPPSPVAVAAARVMARRQEAPPPALTPEEQAAQAQAALVHREQLRQYVAHYKAQNGSNNDSPPGNGTSDGTSLPPARDTRWARQAIDLFMAGHTISHYRLHAACRVLGIQLDKLQRRSA